MWSCHAGQDTARRWCSLDGRLGRTGVRGSGLAGLLGAATVVATVVAVGGVVGVGRQRRLGSRRRAWARSATAAGTRPGCPCPLAPAGAGGRC